MVLSMLSVLSMITMITMVVSSMFSTVAALRHKNGKTTAGYDQQDPDNH
jgi:hypothetical protein